MHPHAMDGRIDALQPRLRALADPSRFRILHLLRAGARCVGEVAEGVGLSQSCTTRHLQVLVRAGLVRREPKGRQVRVTLSQRAEVLLLALGGEVPAGGAHLHSSERPAARTAAAPARAKRRRPESRRAVRATPPDSDTPPSPPPATPAPAPRLPLRAPLEDYLL